MRVQPRKIYHQNCKTLGSNESDKYEYKGIGDTLGYQRDTIQVKFDQFDIDDSAAPTKRIILRSLATIFDPVGLLSPIIVPPKVLFQELCSDRVGWDDPLPAEKVMKWNSWVRDLKSAKEVTIPRCYYEGMEGEILSCSLHGFGDASKIAYSAVIYLVCQTTMGTYVKLVASKTRIAPLKQLTIPRLELMSAKILVTLMSAVKAALKSQVNIDSVHYWLDSQTALYWINDSSEWKQFVQHRVNEILKLSSKSEWGHVSGVDNPADLGSRGVPATMLKDSRLWWQGPSWLAKGKEYWPKSLNLVDCENAKVERKKVRVLKVQVEPISYISNIIDINRYSSLGKLLRVTAYVRRFVQNIKHKALGEETEVGKLSVGEITGAERVWILESQKELQREPSFRKIKENLNVVEQNGILVYRGRLENSDLPVEAKFPIILPKNKFAELIVWECHQNVHHLKVGSTLVEMRTRFWITKGRQFVKRVIKTCFICRKLEGKSYQSVPPAPLLEFRVCEVPPFALTGIDFAGPLYVKSKQGDMQKCYITLFSCCVTRAVHLELIEDLTAMSFLNILRKFCARRGTPSLIVTDNAKTFTTSAKLVRRIHANDKVEEFLLGKRIIWKFNLERASWWGGHFERMVGSVKRCLRKVLRKAKLSFVELEVVLLEVENTINSRPLAVDFEELGKEPLTPSHLLYGRRLACMSSGFEYKADTNHDKLSKRFVYLSTRLSHFWQRWRKEYLVGLREVHRGTTSRPTKVEKGDMVIVEDESRKRGLWKTGIVEQTIFGKDGHTRGAKVRIASTGKSPAYLSRPIQKLYPLEIRCKDNLKDENGMENKLGKSLNSKEEWSNRKEGSDQKGERRVSARAAAMDAKWRTRLMLDSG